MLPTPARELLACLLLLGSVGCDFGNDNGSNLIPPPVIKTEEKKETDSLESPLSQPAGSGLVIDTQSAPVSQPENSTLSAAKETAAETMPVDPTTSVAPVSEPINSQSSMTSALSAPVASTPREIKLLVPAANFAPEGANGPLRVKYDDLDLLMVLNMDPVPLDAVEYFPGWLKDLEGKRVRIRGFMYPPPRQDGITYFQLARDNEICCFGRDPKVYDLIAVEMAEGTSTSYIANRPFDVVGEFHIDPFIDGGKWYELYRLENASVITR